jgi:hypothetical protein
MWQVRHKTNGLFMGVSHGKGHYHIISECCRGLGVFCFDSEALLERFFDLAGRSDLPPRARLKREDFIIEPWDSNINNLLLDEALVDSCGEYLVWSTNLFPVGNN